MKKYNWNELIDIQLTRIEVIRKVHESFPELSEKTIESQYYKKKYPEKYCNKKRTIKDFSKLVENSSNICWKIFHSKNEEDVNLIRIKNSLNMIVMTDTDENISVLNIESIYGQVRIDFQSTSNKYESFWFNTDTKKKEIYDNFYNVLNRFKNK